MKRVASLIAASLLGFVAVPAVAQGPGSGVAPTRATPTRAAETRAAETRAALAATKAARPAAAAEADAAALNEQGLAFYAARDYRHALEKFLGALALANDASLLFNIARCYEQLAEVDAALEKYELFVASGRGDVSGLARARASIEVLQNARRAAAPSATPGGSPAARDAPPSTAALRSPGGAGNWPWLTLAGGAAFVAAGATFYALGARDHARVSDLPAYGNGGAPAGMTWRQARALVDSGNSKKLAGGISLGLGGALAASAVALFLSAERAEQPEARLAVQPSLLVGGGGLLLAGRFH